MNRENPLGAVLTNREPLEPLESDIQPSLNVLEDIRAVVFDVYGTLVISGSGDVGTADPSDKGAHIAAALTAVGISTERIPSIDTLQNQIRCSNDARRNAECPHPEVDIVSVWSDTLAESGIAVDSIHQVVRLATEYESRANPTWPMPDAANLLEQISESGLRLGIVSNAQVFTPLLVQEIGDIFSQRCMFDKNLCVFSNRFRQSKPGPRLFCVLAAALERAGIEPRQAVYVGNDMLNDVWAASQAGLKTAWFAGDRRSCRPRSQDDRCRDLQPDMVLTSLMQLIECLNIQ